MKLKRLFLAIMALIILTVVLRVIFLPKPPVQVLEAAREKISQAEKQKAGAYATRQLQQATAHYDSAMTGWTQQNRRFLLLRNFKTVEQHAQKAAQIAEQAANTASQAAKKALNAYLHRLASVENQLRQFDTQFKHLPLSKEEVKLLASSKLVQQELNNALAQDNLEALEKRLDKLEKDTRQLSERAKKLVAELEQEIPQWNRLVNQAIEESKRKGTALLVVEKYERKCTIYKAGKAVATYKVELGANWMGDKLKAGDKTTPEGHYKVVRKKKNGQTRYYKALLLDYPNEEDKKRFKQNKASGLIPANASIGNLIEIHGDGGKGIDWTDGCVALENKDMDKIFDAVVENTPVVIVGALTVPGKGK
ncbi:L,D-transpeptidase family protein [Roseivirga sp. UBA838]|uniref:L,D-transpeptidase family protein n=1 Tax=Roseivirga sp. UBA838 TaxID=1947393 RepID=UPI00257D423C|nr:L,D-transpeptidase family protein [Roseivirga sp. UBA838]